MCPLESIVAKNLLNTITLRRNCNMKHLRNSLIGLITLLLSFNSAKPNYTPLKLIFAAAKRISTGAVYGFTIGSAIVKTLHLKTLSKENIDNLFAAAKKADDVTLAALLTLARNLDIHAKYIRDEQGRSLLHAVIQAADYEVFSEKTMTRIKIIEMLISEFDIPVNIRDSDKRTASHYVHWTEDKDVTKAFLKKLHELGDDFKSRDQHNLTALDYFLNNVSGSLSDKISEQSVAGISTICKSGNMHTNPTKDLLHMINLDSFLDLYIPSKPKKRTLNDHFTDRAEKQLDWEYQYDYSAMLRALRNDCKCEVSEELLERLKVDGWKETDDEA